MDYTDYDVRVGAYCVLVRDEKILLALWNEADPPEWTMPGGGAEWGESTEETAVREVFEETGYRVQLTGLLGLDDHWINGEQRFHVSGRPMRAFRVIYQASIVSGELRPEVGGTTDEAHWVPLAQVPELHRVSLVDEAITMWRAAADSARLSPG